MSCRWEAISVHKLQRARLEACHCSARGSRRRGRWWGRSPTTAGAGCGSSSTGGDGGSEFGVGAPARSCAGAACRRVKMSIRAARHGTAQARARHGTSWPAGHRAVPTQYTVLRRRPRHGTWALIRAVPAHRARGPNLYRASPWPAIYETLALF